MQNQKHINPIYAIGVVTLIGALAASFLWTKAETLATQFDVESRIAASEQSVTNKTASSQQKASSSNTGPSGSGLVGRYDVDGALLVRYTNTGFSPATINASLRQVIRFRNDSDTAMRIAPGVTAPDDRYYSDLEQGGTVGKGGTFDFGINQTGAFPFTNLNNIRHTGLLIVTQ